jgi:hypothetical protein
VAPYFASNVRPASVDRRVEFEQMTMEFMKDEIFFFAAYNRSDGTRNEFRAEYISLKFRPMSQKYLTETSGKNIYTFNQTKFEKFFWENPHRLRVNMTLVENLQFEFVFDFNSSRASGGHVSIKFSFVVYSTQSPARFPLKQALMLMPLSFLQTSDTLGRRQIPI